MSRYVALLDGGRREERIEVTERGAGLYEVRIGDRVHVVDAYEHDYGTLSLIVDTKSDTATLDVRGPKVHVRVRDSVFPMELVEERALRMRRAPARLTVTGRQVIAARVPARVVAVRTAPGDEVKQGQVLVVVHALGMENELRSPKDGRVVEVTVRAGEDVEGGAPLCTVE